MQLRQELAATPAICDDVADVAAYKGQPHGAKVGLDHPARWFALQSRHHECGLKVVQYARAHGRSKRRNGEYDVTQGSTRGLLKLLSC